MAKYEVFISFKNADRDAAMAERLYRDLKQKNIKVFFSKYSIDESARADYVDAIDEALESALLLVAVGTSKNNLTSQWVKSEINQFRTLVNTDEEGKRSIASYRSKDYPESELPSGIKSYQSFVDRKALVRFIETFLKKDSEFQNNGEVTELLYDASGSDSTDLSDTSNQLQIGSLIDGRYRILTKVGQGGMSIVYLSIDERSNRQYAVKEIRREGIRDFDTIIAAFRKEADLLKIMNHPAIPRVVDIIYTNDALILVSDFVEGESLNKILSESGPFSEESVLDIARQLCGIFSYLHTMHPPIIYRDMKPANIIMKPDGTVMLLDFGTARQYSNNKVEDTVCLGTVGYAAPEQFGGMGQTDARTDIYNLGVTLYHLVTGKNPAEPPYEILPIREVNPNLSRGLEAILLKCTQRDPNARFQSAQELLEALENISSFTRRETLRAFFRWKPSRSGSKKPKKPASSKQPAYTPNTYQIPGRPAAEGLFETTVLPPAPAAPPVIPVPQAPPVKPIVPAPPVKPMPSGPSQGFSIPGTPPVTPSPGFAIPISPPVPRPIPVPVSAEPAPVLSEPVTEILPLKVESHASPMTPPPEVPSPPVVPKPVLPPTPAEPAPEKPRVRKVAVRQKTSANRELEASITKLTALDPKSQRIVRELIDRLSQ